MKEKIKKNWKIYLIIFLSILVVFLFWRVINLAIQNIKLEKELSWVYLQLMKEKTAIPTGEECSDLYGIKLEGCSEIKVLK